MKKNISFILLFVLLTNVSIKSQNRLHNILSPFVTNTQSNAQDGTICIEESFFNIDSNKKMIVINQALESLNSLYKGAKQKIVADDISYTFSLPVTVFETDTAYKVTNPQNDTYELYFTQLPIINIYSENIIVDEPRVYARFSMCEADGNLTESPIGIEYRGGWTQSLPKKSLRVEFWHDTVGNETRNVRLLGMREDDDWNLQAMYNEPLRLRSKINFELWQKIDTLTYIGKEPKAINGINQEYVELFINNEYRGVYALSERVDRKQLKLKKYKKETIRGELYKGVSWGASTFKYLSPYDNSKELWSGFKYAYPDKVIDWANIHGFVDFVLNTDNPTFYNTYEQQFDIDNAVNYFIFLNLLRATDNTGKNLFIARYDKEHPYFYVPWDLDGTYGIIWNGTKENITNDILKNGFYKRLIADEHKNGFLEKLKKRWNVLRQGVISQNSIMERFQTAFEYLKQNGAYKRERKAWSDCPYFDYDNMEYTSEWLKNRLSYLDNVFNNPELLTHIPRNTHIDTKESIRLYPNPANSFVYMDIPDTYPAIKSMLLLNTLGQVVMCVDCNNKDNQRIELPALDSGVYSMIFNFEKGCQENVKLIIKQ